MRLAWKKNGDGWVTRSAEGSEARIYPHPERAKDVYVLEVALGGQAYARGADASGVVAASSSPERTRKEILDLLRCQGEGYLLRFETTGIADPQAANDAIVKMPPLEWRQRLSDWALKNAANNIGASVTETRFVHRGFQMDANRINGRGGQPHMNRLEKWDADGVIEMIISQAAAEEASRGGSLQARKAMGYVQSRTLATTAQEAVMLRKIEGAIFPQGADTPSKRRDVEIVFNTAKYARILVTADGGSKRQPGGILGAREKLAALGMTVMSDTEACAYAEALIAARDNRARQEARETGARLPWWVGRD